jgi:CRP/FNR family transcriptional regulator
MTSEIHDLLKKCEYFSTLPSHYLDRIAGLWRSVTLSRREYLFHEGQEGKAVYLLASGCIQLIKTDKEGGQAVVAVIMPGELFAEAVLFERDDYPVSALAVRKSRVYEMLKINFIALLEDSRFRLAFLKGLTKRLRYLTERIMQLSLYDAEEKFFSFLDHRYGPLKEYKLTMSRKDMARVLGITPETFSRLLKRLEAEGKILWRGSTLKIRTRRK